MQAQTEKMKGELKSEFHGKTVTTTIKEVSPKGVRMENNDVGEIKGEFDARYMQTVSILLKPDGNSEWEGKGIATTKEGDVVVYWGNGKAHPTGADNVSYEGEVHNMTTSPRLSWLNNTTRRIEAKGSRSTGEYRGKGYAQS